MKYKNLPRKEYCYWCQKNTKVFYGESLKTVEFRCQDVTYNEIEQFCTKCHRAAKYICDYLDGENMDRMKDAYGKQLREKKDHFAPRKDIDKE